MSDKKLGGKAGPPGPRPTVKDRKKVSSASREPASTSTKSEVQQPSPSDPPVDAPVGLSNSTAEAPTKSSYDQRTQDRCIDCIHFHVRAFINDQQELGECRGSTPSLGHLIAREQIGKKGEGIPPGLEGRPWGRYPLMRGGEAACGTFKPRMAETRNIEESILLLEKALEGDVAKET